MPVEEGPAGGNNDGTQAIRRAAAILREIARFPHGGATLRQVSEAMDLSRSTTHRILKCLVGERLVAQSSDAKRYTIGELTAELGLAVTSRKDAVLRWRATLEAVARETGATTYLMARSGYETICLDKVDATAAIRYIPQEIGQRRLLGFGGGGIVLLAGLPRRERDDTIAAIEPYLSSYPAASKAGILAAVEAAQKTGFGESRGIVTGDGYGLGTLLPSSGTAEYAISIATLGNLATDENIRRWKKSLKEAIAAAQ